MISIVLPILLDEKSRTSYNPPGNGARF